MDIRIESDYFVVRVSVRNGRVVDAAPIVKWMVGKRWSAMLNYARRKGWKVMEMNSSLKTKEEK